MDIIGPSEGLVASSILAGRTSLPRQRRSPPPRGAFQGSPAALLTRPLRLARAQRRPQALLWLVALLAPLMFFALAAYALRQSHAQFEQRAELLTQILTEPKNGS